MNLQAREVSAGGLDLVGNGMIGMKTMVLLTNLLTPQWKQTLGMKLLLTKTGLIRVIVQTTMSVNIAILLDCSVNSSRIPSSLVLSGSLYDTDKQEQISYKRDLIRKNLCLKKEFKFLRENLKRSDRKEAPPLSKLI